MNDINQYEQATAKSDCQSEKVDKRNELVFHQIAESNPGVITKHDGLFLYFQNSILKAGGLFIP
jgi:hypothetical protein